MLAAQAITIDHASNGRLELAIGTAWHDKEHRALGFEFPPTGARVDLLEDALNILPRLFTEDDVTYVGKQVSVEQATINPKPVQQPSIPIWITSSVLYCCSVPCTVALAVTSISTWSPWNNSAAGSGS